MNHESDPDEALRRSDLHAVWSFVLVLAVLAAVAGVSALMIVNKVEPIPQEIERPVPTVDAVPVKPGTHTAAITSEGAVRSSREVALAAEVSGRVISISPRLVAGGTVNEGEELARIDDADYQVALERAKSAVAEAELSIEQETARGIQAQRDWDKLGRGPAPDLVLRKPQIAAAEARLAAAVAEVERAQRDIRRTRITAPFAGKIRRAHVETGAYLNPGSPVADIFSDREVEVRLPFALADYALLTGTDTPPFRVHAVIGGESASWEAVIERMEGEIDRETLSGFAIARIRPDGNGGFPPPGLFVRADLTGKSIADVVEIPRSTLRGAHDVWVAAEGRLSRRHVEVVRSGRDTLIVRGDFQPGDLLVTTRLNAPVPGMEIKVREPEP